MITGQKNCRGPVSRRGFLQVGALASSALGFSDFLRLQSLAKEAGKKTPDTSVIFVWLPGGAPHMETYDMKPDAPAEYRGIFQPIRTNVPELQVCELLPLHAKCADRYTIIRSISHNFADHGGGHKRFLTGYDPKEPAGFVVDNPMCGSVVAKHREHIKIGLPNYVSIVDAGRQGLDRALPDGGGDLDAGPGCVAFNEAAQGEDVGQNAHPSSTATCWNQATRGGGSQMPAIRTSSRWANIGT